MKVHIPYIRLFIILSSIMLFRCSIIEPADPYGFGVWENGCTGIAVAVNQKDYDRGLLMNHETNERYDLHLCDTSGKIIKTLFTSRQVDGNMSSIDSMDYNASKRYLVIYSVMYGTGKIKREKISLTDYSIVESETLENNGMRHSGNTRGCGNREIFWDESIKWIGFKPAI